MVTTWPDIRDVPTAKQITDAAQRIYEKAVCMRGMVDLHYAAEGWHSDSEFARGKDHNPKDALGRHFDGGSSRDYAEIRTQLEWIVPFFANSLGADPSLFSPSIKSMEDAGSILGGAAPTLDLVGLADGKGFSAQKVKAYSDKHEDRGVPVDIGYYDCCVYARNTLVDWHGHAAENFKKNFLGGIAPAAANQARIAKVLECAIHTDQVLYQLARKDMLEIANKTVNALDFHDSCFSSEADVGVKLGVAAGLLTITAGIATAFTGPGAAVEIAAGATVLAGSATSVQAIVAGPPKGDKISIWGSSVPDVLENCVDAVRKVWGYVDSGEELIIRSLDDAYAKLTDGGLRKHFVSPKPTEMVELSKRKYPTQQEMENDYRQEFEVG